MNEDKKFFISADKLNNSILERLKLAKLELDKLFSTHQRIADIKAGLVYKNGIYLPLRLHRVIFEGYEVQFLDTFIEFFSEMFNRKEDLFREFAIRTIAEMGLKDSQILFSPELTVNEKNKFKLIILLADYAFIGMNHPGRITEYKKLLNDESDLLTQKQLLLFQRTSKCLDTKNYSDHRQLIKIIRKLVESIRSDLYKKTTTPKIFRAGNIEATFSAFSHLIHGNVILLTDVFSTKRPKNSNMLRITWVLLMTGTNTLIQVGNFLKRKAVKFETGDLLKQIELISRTLAKNWQAIEGTRQR